MQAGEWFGKALRDSEMTQWQPIETAPKSEIQFIAFTALGRMFVAHYKFNHRRNGGKGEWQFVGPSPPSEGHKPTHWTPLPEPPK